MRNYLFKYEGREYITLFGMNYLNKKVDETINLPLGLIEATRKSLDIMAQISDVHVSKSFEGQCVATATIVSEGHTYHLDTSNDVNPLSEVTVQVPSAPAEAKIPTTEEVASDVSQMNQEPSAPVLTHHATPVEEPSADEDLVEETNDEYQVVGEVSREMVESPHLEETLGVDSETNGEMEKVVVNHAEVKEEYSPILLQRIDAYTMTPVDMDEVKHKGDTFCEMSGWKRMDDIFMIDDVVSVCRCVHSDTHQLHKTIPYSVVANYGKD